MTNTATATRTPHFAAMQAAGSFACGATADGATAVNITQLASGRYAVIARPMGTNKTWTTLSIFAEWDAAEARWEAECGYGDDAAGCECEQDWNCGCGRFGGATWVETRYDGLPD